MYGGEVRPELFLILSKTPSHAFSNKSGESMRLMLGAAGWKMVAVRLKQFRNAGQSRLSKAVRNADNASSIEALPGFSCATADSKMAVVDASKPKTKNFFRSMFGPSHRTLKVYSEFRTWKDKRNPHLSGYATTQALGC
jgi:hypothetical protein